MEEEKPAPRIKRRVKRKIKEHPKGNTGDEDPAVSEVNPIKDAMKKVRPIKRKVVRKTANGRGNIDPDTEGMDLGIEKKDTKSILDEALGNINDLLEEE